MKNALLSLSFIVAGAACGGFPEPASQLEGSENLSSRQWLEAEADLENGLAYDGCTWLVTVAGVEYAPTARSRAVIEAHTVNIGTTTALIRYRLTGATGTVECGWNTTKSLPEIEIGAILGP
jgi:hypothetical protein